MYKLIVRSRRNSLEIEYNKLDNLQSYFLKLFERYDRLFERLRNKINNLNVYDRHGNIIRFKNIDEKVSLIQYLIENGSLDFTDRDFDLHIAVDTSPYEILIYYNDICIKEIKREITENTIDYIYFYYFLESVANLMDNIRTKNRMDKEILKNEINKKIHSKSYKKVLDDFTDIVLAPPNLYSHPLVSEGGYSYKEARDRFIRQDY